MTAVLVLLTACSSGNPPNRPPPSSTTTSENTTSTSSVSTTRSTPSTVKPTSMPGTTTSVSALGGPRIVALTGPAVPVPCYAPTSIPLRWESRGAQTVTLRIDGEPIFATYRDGAHDELVPLACDGNAHRYTITAHAADGRTATKSLKITEHAR